ncbi:MAG: molybdenum cofactor guanylyltransferase, partial [Thermoplasmata archaeon]
LLVIPCDPPFLQASLCELVVSQAIGRDGAMPKIGGKYQTLHGAYRRAVCLTAFERALAHGRLKPRDALQGLDITYVEEKEIREADPELDSYRNLNSPDDLRWAEKKLSSGHI